MASKLQTKSKLAKQLLIFKLAKQLSIMASQYRNLMVRDGYASLLPSDPYIKETNSLLEKLGYNYLRICLY